MRKLYFLLSLSTVASYATAATPEMIMPWIIGFILIVSLFFWGVFKALKTQQLIYTLAMLPFILLIIGMFVL